MNVLHQIINYQIMHLNHRANNAFKIAFLFTHQSLGWGALTEKGQKPPHSLNQLYRRILSGPYPQRKLSSSSLSESSEIIGKLE